MILGDEHAIIACIKLFNALINCIVFKLLSAKIKCKKSLIFFSNLISFTVTATFIISIILGSCIFAININELVSDLNFNPFVTGLICAMLLIVYYIIVFGILLIVFICLLNKLKFNSISEEEKYSFFLLKEKHQVIVILEKDNKNVFLLADFINKNEIKPAIYTRYNKKIGLLNRNCKTVMYSIMSDNEFKDIRITEVYNKNTKSRMLVVATKKIYNISLNNINLNLYHTPDETLSYNIYGIKVSNDEVNAIKINQNKYKLQKKKYDIPFISK